MRLCLVSAILALLVTIQFQSVQWVLLSLLIAVVFLIPISIPIINRFLAVFCVIVSAFYSQGWIAERLETRLPSSMSGIVVSGYGEVVGCSDASVDVQKLLLKLEFLDAGKQIIPPLKHLSISYYRRNLSNRKARGSDPKEDTLSVKISCGSMLRFKAKLRAPYGFINPWGIDYEAWLMSKGVDASGYLMSHEVEGRALGWSTQLNRLRESWVQRVRNLEGAAGQLVPALLFGEAGYLPKQRWLDFQLTGTIHLLIVSGLHVGFLIFIVTLFWFVIVRLEVLLFFPRSSVLLKLMPLTLIFSCLLYVYMAGAGLAIQRAGLMLGLGICAVFYRHYWSLFDTWLWAMLLVLLINPLSSLFVGYWFSFAAVGALLMSYSGQLGSARTAENISTKSVVLAEKIKLLIHPQWVVFIALIPLLWIFQQPQSIFSFFVNILAIPLLGFVIMPLAIFVFIWPDSIAIEVLNSVLVTAMDFLHRTSSLSDWLVYKPSGLWLLALFPLFVWALFFRGAPFKRLSLLIIVIVFLAPVTSSKNTLIVFDVGQGLAIYGVANNFSWLYDTGAQFRSGFSLGDAVVAKNILAIDGDALDLLFVSHSDNDHAGGEEGLRRRIIPGATYAGQPREEQHKECHGLTGWHELGSGKNRWRVFNYKVDTPSDNNQSCIVQIEMAGKRILLPGDIDIKAEARLLETYGDQLKSDVLIVGHHGSKSSSSKEWLIQVNPDLAIVSSGFKNRYHHPHWSIVKRFKQLSIPFYNTAESGAIEIELSESMPITQWRKKNAPLWRQM
jgi:competence protein ComEC